MVFFFGLLFGFLISIVSVSFFKNNGKMYKVKNKNKHHAADKYYYFVQVNEFKAMFTEEQMLVGEERYLKNKNDIQ